jgi:hypothetical protein
MDMTNRDIGLGEVATCDQFDPSNTHVSFSVLAKLVPPKSTTFALAESKAIPARSRAGGLVVGDNNCQVDPSKVHV